MRNYTKRIALGVLAGTLCLGTMTGCSEELDGTKTVATVNGEEIPMGIVSFMARYQQAQTAMMYEQYGLGSTNGMWETVADEESGETYGEQAVDQILEQIELMYIMRDKAEEYEVTLSEDDQAKIQDAASEFMENNTEETIAEIGVTQEQVEELLELTTYNDRMYNPIVEEAEIEITDEEANQSTVTYITVTPEVEEDAEEATEEEKAAKKAEAEEMLQQVQSAPEGDMQAVAELVDADNASATTLSYTSSGEDETDTVPQEVIDAVKDLQDGQVADAVIEGDNAYYVARMDKVLDEEATENKKETLTNDKKQEYYTETTEKWMEEAEIEVDEKVKETLTITDNHSFVFKTEEAETATGSAVDTATGSAVEAE